MVDKSRMTSAVTVGYLLVILFFYPSYAAFLDLGYSHIHGLSTTESGNDLGDYSSTTDWIRLHPRVRKRDGVQLSIRCCQNDMCNDGTFPNLPPAHRETAVQPLLSNNCNFWNK